MIVPVPVCRLVTVVAVASTLSRSMLPLVVTALTLVAASSSEGASPMPLTDVKATVLATISAAVFVLSPKISSMLLIVTVLVDSITAVMVMLPDVVVVKVTSPAVPAVTLSLTMMSPAADDSSMLPSAVVTPTVSVKQSPTLTAAAATVPTLKPPLSANKICPAEVDSAAKTLSMLLPAMAVASRILPVERTARLSDEMTPVVD